MPKTKEPSPLVAAASALDDALRELASLASEARREPLDTDRSMARATRALTDSVQHQARIEEKLRALVAEIETARRGQQESIEMLTGAAHLLEGRAKSRETILSRFGALGVTAGEVNAMTLELGSRRGDGASDQEVLDKLSAIEARMEAVVSEAQAIAELASSENWPEIARQADAVRQQIQAAKNKLLLAHKNVAGRAPS